MLLLGQRLGGNQVLFVSLAQHGLLLLPVERHWVEPVIIFSASGVPRPLRHRSGPFSALASFIYY